MKKVLFILFLTTNLFGRMTITDYHWLSTRPSAGLNGMGGMTTIATDHVLGSYNNPAAGLKAYDGISAIYANSNNEEYSIFGYDYMLSYYGVNVLPASIPLKLVLSYYQTDFDSRFYTIWGPSQIHAENKLSAFSVATAYTSQEIPFNFYLGLTRKKAEEFYKNASLEGGLIPSSLDNFDDILYDFGGITEFPLRIKTINEYPAYSVNILPSVGFSLSNYGGRYDVKNLPHESSIYSKKMAHPRQFRLGIAISGQLRHKSGYELLKFHVGREISDILVDTPEDYTLDQEYTSIWNDIKIFDNLIMNNGQNVDIHTGFEVSFLDFIAIRYGTLNHYYNYHTSGIGVNSNGLFKLLSLVTGHNLGHNLSNYLEINYNYGNEFPLQRRYMGNGDSYNTVSVRLKNLNQLLQKKAVAPTHSMDIGTPSVLLGFGMTGFKNNFIVMDFERKFNLNINLGVEQQIGALRFNLSYKQKDADYKTEHDNTIIENHYINFSSLYPVQLVDKITLLPGFQIGGNVQNKFQNDDYKFNSSVMPNLSLILSMDFEINKDCDCRIEYDHGLTNILANYDEEMKSRSLNVYLKYNFFN